MRNKGHSFAMTTVFLAISASGTSQGDGAGHLYWPRLVSGVCNINRYGQGSARAGGPTCNGHYAIL